MQCDTTINIASYEKLKSAIEDSKTDIIDVREPDELQQTGVIPNSVNIPLAQIEDELKSTSAEDYKAKFQCEKPNLNSDIIFTCRSGRRSLLAAKVAKQLGYAKVSNFNGGWLLWDEKNKGKVGDN